MSTVTLRPLGKNRNINRLTLPATKGFFCNEPFYGYVTRPKTFHVPSHPQIPPPYNERQHL